MTYGEDKLKVVMVRPDGLEQWESFPSLPGQRLFWEYRKGGNLLKSEDGLVLASSDSGWSPPPGRGTWVLTGSGRRYRYQSSSTISDEEIADLDVRYGRDFFGEGREGFKRRRDGRIKYVSGYGTWTDAESGEVVLRGLGLNYDFKADSHTGLPDGRYLRFPVRRPPGENNRRGHAVMYAECGQRNEILIRYRYRPRPQNFFLVRFRPVRTNIIEIVVSPGVRLDDPMVLAIATSASYLSSFFHQPGGGR